MKAGSSRDDSPQGGSPKEGPPEESRGPRPTFFIVGAAKCGTTSLYEYLVEHPQIYMPRKEPDFFASDLPFPGSPKTVEEYEKLYADGDPKKIAGDVSVWYLYSKTAARNIYEYCPDARIIISLRDPVQMIYAHFGQMRVGGQEPLDDFAAAIEAEETRRADPSLVERAAFPVEHFFYRDIGRYGEQVQRYLDVFPREQVMLIDFADLVADTPAVYREIVCFLDLDAEWEPSFEVHNPSRMKRSELISRLVDLPPSWFRSLAVAIFPLKARRVILDTLRGWNSKKAKRPPLDPQLRDRLQDELRPDLHRLAESWGKDLSHWPTY